ncbi:MAG: O-antigen ligase family protein [Proteobacteria bacterium]|nr:O-antigen ligase family protein [Pseudomonadota bacterium]
MRVRDRVTFALVAIALLTSVLVVGGVLRWTQAIVAGVVALALLTQIRSRRTIGRSPLVLLLSIAVGLTALQLVPLPDGLLARLDPVGHQLRLDGLAIAGTSSWSCISLDPAHTLGALAFLIILLGVALLSLRIAAHERGRYMLLAGVAIACGLAALATGIHTLVGADALYGLYEPQRAKAGPVFGPLLNPNHLGGLMAMGSVLSLGLAFYHRQITQLRVLWIVIAVGCVVVMGMSLSRGAMVGFGIGLLTAAGVAIASRTVSATPRRRRSGIRTEVLIAIVVGLGLVIALYFTAGNVVSQLGDTAITEVDQPGSKFAAWKSSLQLVAESPWVGVGRGAIESTLTRVNPGSGHFTYSHLENEYLSAVVEWGIPGTVLLALAAGWCLLVAFRRRLDGPLAAAALGALAVIVFQSSVDFGIEILGVAVPFTIVASTVQLAALRETDESYVRILARRLVVLVPLIGSTVVLLLPMTTTLREDHDDLDETPTVERSREIIARHPLDYLAYGQAATKIARTDGAVRYLNHALRLHPTYPGLHRIAARMLVSIGQPAQAAIEYGLAMNAEPYPRQLLAEILKMLPDPAHAAAAIPTDYKNFDGMMRSLRDLKRPDIAMGWLERVAERPQHDLRVIDLLYRMAMDHQAYDAAKTAAELRLRVAHTTTSKVQLAKVLFVRHEYDRLLVDLADVATWTGRIDEKAEAWLVLCDVHITQQAWDPALKCIHRLDASGLVLPGARSQIQRRVQAINEARERESKRKAIEMMERQLLQSGANKSH